MMHKSAFRLYAPFLAIVLAQALLVAVAPSVAPDRPVAQLDPLDPDAPPPAGEADEVEAVTGQADDAAPELAAEPGAVPQHSPGAPARPGTEQPAAPQPPGESPTGAAGVAGDTSHCTPDGRQHGVAYHAPPCAPKWPDGADNGGATYRGVEADEVRVVFFVERKNEQLAALLAQEGLARTLEQEREFMEAAEEFLNDRYEFYGRTLRLILYHAEACPETPPDIPACIEEARNVVREHDPFMILWPVPIYPEVFDEWARLGVPSVGGWHFDERYFIQRRPYRWDVFMDGTQSVDIASEYYCNKMARQNATHSGRVIHPEIGVRDQVPRRVGVIAPENDAYLTAAHRLLDRIGACDDHDPILVTYVSDIEQSPRQTAANVGALIDANVTTVMCLCDPVVPIFRTYGMTRQGYYPEHLLIGTGLLDYDKVGRLYDPQQWVHAFGPSHLAQPLSQRDTEASRVWRESGRSGNACGACPLSWSYYNLGASLIQMAGPTLTPQTMERGALGSSPRGGWEQTGGRADLVLGRFGQADYTYISDIREAYWDPRATSPIDGRPGAYVALHGGRRFEAGQWDSRLQVPVAPQ